MIAYLDNSATTRPLESVCEYMNEINHNFYGNPSSLHNIGFEAEKILKKARATILDFLGDKEGNLIFTSGGTEANNLAILGYLRGKLKRSPEIITSKVEHPSVTEPFLYLGENGANVVFCDVDDSGAIDLLKFEKAVSEKTEFVSLMLVNNEVGALMPVEKASKILKSKNPNAVFHVDAVQAFGKVKIDVLKMGIDMLSISGHKICGPKGIGALYVKKGINLLPIVFGGHQEKNLRSGTENVPAIGGLYVAATNAKEKLDENINKMTEQKNKMAEAFCALPFITTNGGVGENFAPNILNISIEDVKSEVMLHSLEKEGVFVSSGSACSSNKPAPSHVLLAMGKSRKETDTAIRLSLSSKTTDEEVDYAISVIKKTATELHSILHR